MSRRVSAAQHGHPPGPGGRADDASQPTAKHQSAPAECIINKYIRCTTVPVNFSLLRAFESL